MRHPILAALGALAVYFLIALYIKAVPMPTVDPTIMRPPFRNLALHAYHSYHLVPHAKADTPETPEQSTVQLYEDDRPLGPAHSPHEDISAKGHGRYSFWYDHGSYVIFSTSDNSDPNTNGRTYRLVDPKARDPYLSPQPPAQVAGK